jgi:hypothetical protein
MAIMAIAEIPGATREMYDAINERIGIGGDEDAPPGLISHVGAVDEKGVTIVDVWESEQAFHSFLESIAGEMQETGIPPFEPRILPVHNMLEGRGTEPNFLMVVEMPGLTPEFYDRMTAQMDAHTGDGSNHPAVSHTAGRADGGLVVVDVWDSPESFQRTIGEQLPEEAAAQLGPIEPRFVPVMRRLRGKAPTRT